MCWTIAIPIFDSLVCCDIGGPYLVLFHLCKKKCFIWALTVVMHYGTALAEGHRACRREKYIGTRYPIRCSRS